MFGENSASELDEKFVWDPGGEGGRSPLVPNEHVCSVVCSALENEEKDGVAGNVELDSHANMVVLGKYCHIIRWTGKNVEVQPFSPDYQALQQVPVVDAAVMYVCPRSGKEHLLVVRNALYCESMENNLIPPFIM